MTSHWFGANGAAQEKPGASPQEFRSPSKQALKARFNSGVSLK